MMLYYPCDIYGICPYSTDPTPNTCEVYCDYPDRSCEEVYEYEVTD